MVLQVDVAGRADYQVSPLRYVTLGIWAALLGLLWLQSTRLDHARDNLAAYKAGQEAFHQVRMVKLADARKEKDDEITTLRAYRDAHPVGVVRLCRAASPVPAGAAPGAVASAATDGLQPMHEGATPATDIGPMLDAFAASCDAVSADLREQQRVR